VSVDELTPLGYLGFVYEGDVLNPRKVRVNGVAVKERRAWPTALRNEPTFAASLSAAVAHIDAWNNPVAKEAS
jgi:hypothetical protein